MPRCERGGAGSKPAGHPISGRGVVVAHLPWEQVYGGSNPAAQTMGGDLGSGWSPKPASEVQSLGRPQHRAESAPRGGELVPKTSVTCGSEVRFLRSPQRSVRRRRACGFARLFAKQVDHGPGGSTPLVSSVLRWTEGIGGGLQNRLHAGSSPARSSNALKVFSAARWLARSEERVQVPLSALDARVADRHEAPAFQAGEAGSIPAACSKCFFLQGGCWHPSRPHKPAPVGSIPTPATGATSWCCSSKSASQGPTSRKAPA